MKKMIASALMTGLLCVGSVAGWAADPVPAPPPPCPPAADAGYMPGPGQGRGPARGRMGDRRQFMKQYLNLSDKQDARLRELQQAHFREIIPIRQELSRLRGELATESVRKRTDEKKISEIAALEGKQHEKLALLQSRHLKELSTVLDQKQIDTLLKMRAQHGFGKGRGWR